MRGPQWLDVAAFAQELTRALLARTILHQPVVRYRQEDGTAVAVGGGCPHRHVSLASGCLKRIITSRIYHAVTPPTLRSCIDFFAMPSADASRLNEVLELLKPVSAEDRFATEEIEKRLAISGDAPEELLIRSDRNAVEGRRMRQAMMDAERETAGI